MLDRPQSQSLDGSGNALQAGNDIHLTVNRGMSYSDVREIALDIVRANLQEFRGQAIEIAQARAEAVTDKFLQKLMSENPIGLQQAQTPDFQDALFTVQKEHAKAGDEDLADLLVDLLVDRTKQTGRNLMQLVLNEALHTAPKLPGSHAAALSVIFLLRHVNFPNSTSAAQLGATIQRFLSAIDTDIGTSESTFAHLKFTGCGANESFVHVTLEEIWLAEYPGLFRTGFGSERLDDLQVSPAIVAALKIPCVNDVTKFQLSPLTPTVLNRI